MKDDEIIRLVIAGSRHIDVNTAWYKFTLTLPDIDYWYRRSFPLTQRNGYQHVLNPSTQWLTGMCDTGPDQLPILGQWPYYAYRACWDLHGKAAGPIRNRSMAKAANGAIIIWDKRSRGSANMKAEMLRLGKPVYEIFIYE